MSPVEFIKKNIKNQLLTKGYSEQIASKLALDAVSQYSQLGNQNGKMLANLISQAEKRAKQLKSAESRKQKKGTGEVKHGYLHPTHQSRDYRAANQKRTSTN